MEIQSWPSAWSSRAAGCPHAHVGRVSEFVPGVQMPQLSSRGVGQTAHLCLSHSGCSALISLLRLKARRKQAAGRPKAKDDEDPVMGTVSWVNDVSVFSSSVWVHLRSPDSATSPNPFLRCQLGRQQGADVPWAFPLSLPEPVASLLPTPAER